MGSAYSGRVNNDVIDSSAVVRALEIDAYCDMELHNDIAQLIQAVREGRDSDVAYYAKAIAGEYASLENVTEFTSAVSLDEVRAH